MTFSLSSINPSPLKLQLIATTHTYCRASQNPPAHAGDIRNLSSIPRWGRSPGGGHSHPLQYSCLENPMDRAAWRAAYSLWGRKQSDASEHAQPTPQPVCGPSSPSHPALFLHLDETPGLKDLDFAWKNKRNEVDAAVNTVL